MSNAPTDAAAVARQERVRKILREWIDTKHAGVVTRAAAQLGLSHTLVRGVVSGRRYSGLRLVTALAAATGRSADDIMGVKRSGTAAERKEVRLGTLDGWREAEREVRDRFPWLPRPAIRWARRLKAPTDGTVSPMAVFAAAMLGAVFAEGDDDVGVDG